MKKKYFTPLVFFVIPTVICSALMWPPEAMKVNLIGGFALMILSAIMTYIFGLRLVLKDQQSHDHGSKKL